MTTTPAPAPVAPPPATPPAAPRRRSLRAQLSVTLALAVGLPLLAAGGLGAWLLAGHEAEAAEQGLTNIAAAVARRVETHVRDRLTVVREAAGHAEEAGRLDGALMGGVLARIHALHPDFLTMLAADAEGWILVVSPASDPDGRPRLAVPQSVADREYFAEPMRTGLPHVSGVFRGRGLGNDPIVGVSAPVLVNGRRLGVVEGSLDLARLPLLEGLRAPAPFDVVLLDGDERIIWSTPGAAYQPLDRPAPGVLGALRRHAGGTGVDRFRRDGEEFLAAVTSLEEGGWHVVIQARTAEIGKGARRFLATVVVVLLAGVAVALALALALARRATAPLEQLGRSVGAFLSGEATAPLRLEPGAPREVAELVEGYEELQRRVGHTLSGLLPVCAWCRRIRDDQARWHPLERYVEARFDAAVTHCLCPECERRMDAADPGDPPGPPR